MWDTCKSSWKMRLFSARLVFSLLILALGVIKAKVSTLGVLYSGNVSQVRRLTVELVANGMLQSAINQTDAHIRTVWSQSGTDGLWSLPKQVCRMLDDGALGVVAILHQKNEDVLHFVAGDLCLPQMTFVTQPAIPEIGKGHSQLLSTQNQLIKDLLRYFHWKAVGIFYHTHIDKDQLTDLIYSLSERLIQVTLIDIKVFSGASVYWPAVPNRVLFIGTPAQFYKLYTKLEGTHLTSDTLWLVMAEEMTGAEIRRFFANRAKGGIVFVKRKWKDTYKCQGSLAYQGVDTCFSLTEDLIVRSLLMLHEDVYRTYIKDMRSEARNCSRCPDVWKATNGGFGRDNGSAVPFSFSPVYEIHGIENFWRGRGSSFRRKFGTKVGEWNKDLGLKFQQDFPFQNVWHDFGNETIYVAAIEAPPFIIKTEIGGATRFSGFCIDVMNELASKMGFNYTIVEPPDGYFGAPNEDGTWNGMVGMVYRGEVEMATGPVTITSLRERVIDFTTPITEGSTGIIMRSPGYAAGKSLFQTLKPFSTAVWLSICAAIVIVSMVSYFVNCCTPYKLRYCRFPEEEEMTSLKGNFWIIYASITEQGVDAHPSSTSGRCILGFWWVFTIVLVAAYTDNLTAVLTVAIPPSPIGSLGQLLAQDAIQPIVLAGSSFETLFQNSESQLYRETWERLKKAPKVAQEPAILEMVKHGGYGYIADKPILDYRASRECQAFSVAEESFDVVGYGIVIPEGVPYASSMNTLIVKMQEAGLMEKWRRYWWAADSSCKDSFQTVQSRLGLDSLGGLFLLYMGTVLLACFCCLTEIFGRTKSKGS